MKNNDMRNKNNRLRLLDKKLTLYHILPVEEGMGKYILLK